MNLEKGQFAVGRHNATNGEFLQGQLPSGKFFHVTCPLAVFSTVRVTVNGTDRHSAPEGYSKALKSAEMALRIFEMPRLGLDIEIISHVPIGKGMGSSTADVVASARAVAALLKRDLSSYQLAKIASSIESSDGSMYRGMVCFAQRAGDLLYDYSWWPDLVTICMDTGGMVRTDEVCNRSYSVDQQHQCEEFLQRSIFAVKGQDVEEFCRATTLSAEMNQKFLPRKEFQPIKQLGEEFGALGYNVAHTGTLISAFFRPEHINKADSLKRELRKLYPEKDVFKFTTVYNF